MNSLVVMLAFTGALVLMLGTRLWLISRQIRHVVQHRDRVPAAFADIVGLAAHQKAADYTVARQRFELLTTAWGAVMLLGWTLLGGLDALNVAVRDLVLPHGGALAYQIVLVLAVSVIGSVLDVPFDLWRTFRIELRFGFTQMTPPLWLTDLVKSTLIGAVIGLPIAALILWLMGAAGPLWWLWAWGVWMGFNLLLMVVIPVFIANITDPTGHRECYQETLDCSRPQPHPITGSLVKFTGDWESPEKAPFHNAASQMAQAMFEVAGDKFNSPREVILAVFNGAISVTRSGQSCAEAFSKPYFTCYGSATATNIAVYANANGHIEGNEMWALHEMFHSFNGNSAWQPCTDLRTDPIIVSGITR